ncbi:MAG: 50S ribosomal protein L11 methyltransferase [Pseudomonadales bacterium]|jgi:ribosomal protein L11 methyltransferase|nr:50S ribosomal protein L11 methyltransferase [Pseudomonadales bacterium]
MGWLQLQLRCAREQTETLEDLLLAAGAVSVTLRDAEDEPLFEPGVGETPLWREVLVIGLFPGDAEQGALERQLLMLADTPLLPLHWERLPEQDWVRTWLDDFKPMRFGTQLWVCPSWWHNNEWPSNECQSDERQHQSATPEAQAGAWQPSPADAAAWAARNRDLLDAMAAPAAVVLKLDPGLAFGTGTHPTTALCLRWLDAHPPRAQAVIDYGCGSGILGIAALLLGAKQAFGVDTDPQALHASAENCAKNALDPARFPVYLPQDFAALHNTLNNTLNNASASADGVLANILAGTLIELAPALCAQVKTGGWLLLSGILREQAAAVIERFRPWCKDFEIAVEGDWVSISAKRL